MNLLSLEVKNLYSYKELHIDFRKYNYPVFIKGRSQETGMESNGSGKSRIPNIICWILYGKDYEGIFGAKVLRDKNEGGKSNDGYGTLIFEINGTKYYIKRHYWIKKRKNCKSGLLLGYVSDNGKIDIIKSYTRIDRECESRVRELIGYDYNSFLFLTYLSSKDNIFLIGKDSDRFKVFTSLCGRSLYDADKAILKIKEDIKSVKESLNFLYGKESGILNAEKIDMRSVNVEKKKILSRIKKLKQEMGKVDKIIDKEKEASKVLEVLEILKVNIRDKRHNLSRLKKQKTKLNREKRKALKDVKDLKLKIRKCKDRSISKSKISKLDIEIENFSNEISRYIASNSKREAIIENGIERIGAIEELKRKGICPTCYTDINKKEISENIAKEKSKIINRNLELGKKVKACFAAIKKLRSRIEDLKTEKEICKSVLEEIENYNYRLDEAKYLLDRTNRGLRNLNRETERNLKDIDSAKQKIRQYSKFRKVHKRDLRPLINKRNALQDDLYCSNEKLGRLKSKISEMKRLKIELDKVRGEKKEAKKKLSIAQWSASHMPIVKSRIINSMLSSLEQVTNEYLSYLFPNIEIKYNIIITEGRRRDKFEIIIKDKRSGAERVFKQWSSGERKRIAISIIMALSWLVDHINLNKRIGFVFLDEIFGGLDSIGRQCVLDAVSGKEKDVFIITHLDQVEISKERNVIMVSKTREGVSEIEEKIAS